MKFKSLKFIILIIVSVNFSNGQTPFVEDGKFWVYQNHEDIDFLSPISGHDTGFHLYRWTKFYL